MMDKSIESKRSPSTAKTLAFSAQSLYETFPDLFAHFNQDELALMSNLLHPIQVSADRQPVITQNQWTDTMYLVCSGVLSVCVAGGRREIELGLIERGQWVGDVSVIEPGPASATVTVIEDANLLMLTHDQLQWLRERYPSQASYILQAISLTMANRLRESSINIHTLDTLEVQNKNHSFTKESTINWSVALHRWMYGINKDRQKEYHDDELVQRRRELESVYQHRFRYEKEQMLNKERERILAELHDGVGGQLVAMLSMLDNNCSDTNDLKNVVRGALDDLRLMIDSLDSVEGDIPVVLGMLRSRIEPRLKVQNLSFDWQITELPPITRLGPHEILQLLRIMQEAITNIIKHAQASTIIISTKLHTDPELAPFIRIVVHDNGRGLDNNTVSQGHGFASMQNRARALGGSLLIDNAEQGVRVQLDIPIDGE